MSNASGFLYQCFIACVICICLACNPSKQLLINAHKADLSGDAESAANLYYNVLLVNPNQKEAKLGLKINGQKVLSDKFARFSKYVIDNEIENAVQAYLNAQGYYNNALNVNVKLDWPAEYDEIFVDIKKEYLIQKFDYAIQLIQQKKFENAERTFEQMAQVDTSYRSVSVLRLNTVLEPVYQKGIYAYQQTNYRDAYFLFDKVVSIDDGYKDALQYKKLAQQKATQLLGILPISYATSKYKSDFDLTYALADKLATIEGKYLRIANLNQLHQDLESRGFTHLNNADHAIEAAKATGLSYGLLIKIDTFIYNLTSPSVKNKDAYEAITENILNPYTKTYQSITRFKKVTYTDKSESQNCSVAVTYYLVDAKTTKILTFKQIKYTEKDEIHAASFEGNPANIYPFLPEGNYLPQVSQEWHDMFFAPRKNLYNKQFFIQQMIEKLATQISNEVSKNIK